MTHPVIISLNSVECCNGMANLVVLQLVEGTVVYTDNSVHCGDRSGCGFSARIKREVIAEQGIATTSGMST